MIVSELNLEVRYYETDLMGIVHHSNYVRYFECGRHKLLQDIGLPIEIIEASGIMMPVVSVFCKYKSPAKMGDILRIVTTIKKIPLVKIVAEAQIFNSEGTLICEGEVVVGFIHSDSRKPTRTPQILLDKVNKFFE
jgi:acyl-CoA thioester hydrolase, YbgC/YbaW family